MNYNGYIVRATIDELIEECIDEWTIWAIAEEEQAECVGTCEGCYNERLIGGTGTEVAPYYVTECNGESPLTYCTRCIELMLVAPNVEVVPAP